jgi:hypothetical protein
MAKHKSTSHLSRWQYIFVTVLMPALYVSQRYFGAFLNEHQGKPYLQCLIWWRKTRVSGDGKYQTNFKHS